MIGAGENCDTAAPTAALPVGMIVGICCAAAAVAAAAVTLALRTAHRDAAWDPIKAELKELSTSSAIGLAAAHGSGGGLPNRLKPKSIELIDGA